MPESSQVLRISRIELQNAGKVESAQLIVSGSPHEVQKQQGSNILRAEFSPPLEVQDTFYLSHRKLVLGVWKRSEKKKSFDPHEVLSKLEDRQFRSRVQGGVTIVLDILPPNPPPIPLDTAIPHTPPASGSLTPTTDEILRQCPRFRILIVGKVGVGKTSLINKTFGIDDPVARPEHDKRGEANIETPLYSKSNERFVLHDSKGFEPGEKDNLASVEAFIERRKTHKEIQERLHAVWLSFQVPLESLGQRVMEAGMEEFLRKKSSILGNIPTIFVFTKYDMLAEDIERRWIRARKSYNDAEVDLEADRYLKERCIQRIEELTGQKGIPYIAVSSKPRFQGRLTQLTELTHAKVSEYFVERHGGPSPVPVVTAVAQRVAPDLKIEGSVSVGKRRYWKAIISGADFSGHTIMDCIHVIHTDIVKIWNFYDPSKLLLCDDFRDFMLKLVDTLENPKTLARRDTPLTAEGGAALVAMIPIRLSIIIGTRILQWARESYKRVPEVQRKFIAYIADLTHVLDIIFTLVANRREKQLTIRIIKVAIVTYQTSMKRRDVHIKIKGLPIAALVGGCDVNAEMESIVKSRYITDDDLKEKVDKITPVELKGDEDWNDPQSHGGN